MTSPQFVIGALIGSLVSAGGVVLAGRFPALLLIMGFVLATFLYAWLVKLIGRARLVKWLSASNGAERSSRLPHDTDGSRFQPRAVRYAGLVAGNGAPGEVTLTGDRQRQSQGWSLARKARAAVSDKSGPGNSSLAVASKRARGKARERVRPLRKAPTYNKPTDKTVLPTVAQDVLSALCNLQAPFKQAHEIVSAEHKLGDSFDDLFRRCMEVLSRGRTLSRKVA